MKNQLSSIAIAFVLAITGGCQKNTISSNDGYFGSICASVFGVVSASDSGPNCAII